MVKPGGTGGEIDFAETDVGSGGMNAFLHPPKHDRKQQSFHQALDVAQWHTYALEWTPTHLTGYIDGHLWYDVTDPQLQPGGPMSPTIQLDANDSGGLAPATMDVDWLHVYAPPAG